jgi:hypothetical protein
MRFAGPFFNGFPFDELDAIPELSVPGSFGPGPEVSAVPMNYLCDLSYLQVHWLFWRLKQLEFSGVGTVEIEQPALGTGDPLVYDLLGDDIFYTHTQYSTEPVNPETEQDLVVPAGFNFGVLSEALEGEEVPPANEMEFRQYNEANLYRTIWFSVRPKIEGKLSLYTEPNAQAEFELYGGAFFQAIGYATFPLWWTNCPSDPDGEYGDPPPESGCEVAYEGRDYEVRAISKTEEELGEGQTFNIEIDLACPYGNIEATMPVEIDTEWSSDVGSIDPPTLPEVTVSGNAALENSSFWGYDGTWDTTTGEMLKDPNTGEPIP